MSILLAPAYRRFLLSISLVICSTAPAFGHLALLRQGFECGDVPDPDDRFGYVLTTGDFDNDGYDDLVSAATWESNSLVNTAAHGLVHVNYGTHFGLTHVGASVLSPGAPPTDNAIRFGRALAAGDFNGDGFDDLAVGAPDMDFNGVVDAGGVFIYDGYAGGLQLAASWIITQDALGFTNSTDDNFGWSLVAGDFDNDGFDDLAIGCLGEDNDLGAVFIVSSSGSGGLAATGAEYHSPFTLGHSTGVMGGWFGASLAAGDLDQDGFDDLVIGAPKSDIGGIGDSGRLYLLHGSATGIDPGSLWLYDNVSESWPILDSDLELGWSVAVGHFRDGSAYTGPLQVVAGAPGYDQNGNNDSGAVIYFTLDETGRTPGGGAEAMAQVPGLAYDDVLPQDRFGETLAVGRFDADGWDDLAIGVVYDDIQEDPALGQQGNSGSVYLRSGGANGFSDNIHITAVTLNDHVGGGDNLGRGLAFGRFDGSGRASLAVGAPSADYPDYEGGPSTSNSGRVYIHAPWRQARSRPHRGSAVFDCDGNLVYSQRAWQRLRPASTTKTMTLQLACDAVDGGQDMDELFVVPQWIADSVGGSQVPLFGGETISFGDLIKTMMTVSGNDAAMLLGKIMSGEGDEWDGWSGTSPGFAVSMETKASQLGLSSSTSLTNAAGIDSGDHYVTPRDWAWLAYQSIQDPCVKNIVNTSPWEVERLMPPAQWNGFLNLATPVKTTFYNGFVSGLKTRLASGVGVKGGHTPGAFKTGLWSSDPPGTGGQTGAGAFGIWDDDEPFEGVAAGCLSCTGAELLMVAESSCADTWPDGFVAPGTPPGPWGTLLAWEPVLGSPPVGLVFPVNAGETLPRVPQTQIDVLRQNQALPTAQYRQIIHRTSEVCIPSLGTAEFGIAPYQQHFGFRIVNRDSQAVDLTVTATDPLGFLLTGTVSPDSALVVPAAAGAPSSSFQLQITNNGRSGSIVLEVEERGYGRDVSLGDGVTVPDTDSQLLTHDPCTRQETVSVFLEGLDAVAGNLLAVSAHHTDAPSGTDDGGLVPGAVKPARSGLLPNVPNPFNPATFIRFDVRQAGPVEIVIYDVRGRAVRQLAVNEIFTQGRHRIRWDGRNDTGAPAGSGVYLVRLRTPDAEDTQRILLLK